MEVTLDRLRTELGILWACPGCRGRAVTFPLLRRQVERNFMNSLWQQILEADRLGHTNGRPCPGCRRPMIHFACSGVADSFQLDACRACQFLWFDPDEVLQLPIVPTTSPQEKELTPDAKEAAARAKVEILSERARREDRHETGFQLWHTILQMLTRID